MDKDTAVLLLTVLLVLAGAALAWVMSRGRVALLLAFLCALQYFSVRAPERAPLLWFAGASVYFATAVVAELRDRFARARADSPSPSKR